MDFLQGFAEWLEEWSLNGSSTFALTKQTSSALVQALHAQCSLVKELLFDGFDYVRLGKLQSDPSGKKIFSVWTNELWKILSWFERGDSL